MLKIIARKGGNNIISLLFSNRGTTNIIILIGQKAKSKIFTSLREIWILGTVRSRNFSTTFDGSRFQTIFVLPENLIPTLYGKHGGHLQVETEDKSLCFFVRGSYM